MEMVQTSGFAARILNRISAEFNAKVLSTGDEEGSFTAVIDTDDADGEPINPAAVEAALREELSANCIRRETVSLITCVGEGSSTSRNKATGYLALADAGINEAFSTNSRAGRNTTFIVDPEYYETALRALHTLTKVEE